MKRVYLSALFLLGLSFFSQAQVLFTYAGKKVLAEDFIRSYNKNNIGLTEDAVQTPEQYFNTFVHNKLAIEEALAQKVDQKPEIKNDIDNFRSQLANRYMVDSVTVKKLTNEAFIRSQKALHVFHIFISFQNTTGIFDNAQDLGLITVFSLPYAMENVVYGLKPGQLSKAVVSKTGFHFFKLIESIDAPGYLQLQQILLAYPAEKDSVFISSQKKLADSLFTQLQNGSNFDSLATQFSNDNSSSLNNGYLQEIGVGVYDPVFEKQAWSLSKDGMIAKPFETSFGIHILKRISHRPIVTDKNNIDNNSMLLSKIMLDTRWKASTAVILAQVKKAIGASALKMSETELLDYYKEHLENFNLEFKRQLEEIKEGILYFDIMQTEVWSKVNTDSATTTQAELENNWFDSLAKKYPISVNEKLKKTTLKKLQKN